MNNHQVNEKILDIKALFAHAFTPYHKSKFYFTCQKQSFVGFAAKISLKMTCHLDSGVYPLKAEKPFLDDHCTSQSTTKKDDRHM